MRRIAAAAADRASPPYEFAGWPRATGTRASRAIASYGARSESRIADLIRRDPERAANAVEVGLVDRDWLEQPGRAPDPHRHPGRGGAALPRALGRAAAVGPPAARPQRDPAPLVGEPTRCAGRHGPDARWPSCSPTSRASPASRRQRRRRGHRPARRPPQARRPDRAQPRRPRRQAARRRAHARLPGRRGRGARRARAPRDRARPAAAAGRRAPRRGGRHPRRRASATSSTSRPG